MMDSQEDTFAINLIIEQIRNTGCFQKRFNFVFNFILAITVPMAYLNIVLSVATPDHWCHVPGREDTNYTLDEWKNMTIPMEVDSKRLLSYSKCKRFAIINKTCDSSKYPTSTSEDVETVKCDHGWDYDRTWYDQTASTQNDWVCDDAMVPVNVLALGCISESIGVLIFGQLADNYGRMPVFFTTISMLVFGRVIAAFTSSWEYAFMVSAVIGYLPSISVILGPLVIGMEISRVEDRAMVSMLMNYGWILGIMITPLIMWWLRDWVPFLLVATLPSAVFLFSKPWMIESPRWLVWKGKFKRCIKELGKVARMNNTHVPSNAESLLKQGYARRGKKKHHTVLCFFANARLAKNMVVLVNCYAIINMIYFGLTVDVGNLGGNPFLNYLLQAIAEVPGCFLAKYISDRFGRRWATVTCFLVIFCGCIPIMILINDLENFVVISVLCMFLKFGLSMGLYSVYLQSVEIYPTCIRQSGLAMNLIIGSLFGVVSPYIISLGVTVLAVLPYVIYSIFALAAAISCLFLPETLGHQLPESLEDAARFGADQDFWGRRQCQKDVSQDRAEVPLNL